MKRFKLFTFAIFFGALLVGTAAPQKGLVITPKTWWRIVDGPGAGAVIEGDQFGNIFDDYYEANGFIAFGHFEDCECTHFDGHYHGVLFDSDDPSPGHCGWGCVIQVPCTPDEAATNLQNQINFIGSVDPDLADKLQDIYDTMQNAAAAGCYGVVDALADAFSDEIHAYFLDYGLTVAFDPAVRALLEYVDSTLDSLADPPFLPVIPANTVKILDQIGSGPRGRLLDPGPRINARVGDVLSFQALTTPGAVNPMLLWNYKWKGMPEGELPEGCATSFYHNRLSIVAEKKTSVSLSVLWRMPTGRVVRDRLNINFTEF
jgi:hypothetical protein